MQLAQLRSPRSRSVLFNSCTASRFEIVRLCVSFEYDSYIFYSILRRMMSNVRQNAKHAWRFYANTCHTLITFTNAKVFVLLLTIYRCSNTVSKKNIFCKIKKNEILINRTYSFFQLNKLIIVPHLFLHKKLNIDER